LVPPFVRRWDKNRLLFDHGAVEILRAVEERRASGETLTDAKAWVAVSLQGEEGSEPRRASGETSGQAKENATAMSLSGEVAALHMLIDELRNERDHWRSMAEKLQDQLALPALKGEEPRRSWIVRLLQPLIASRA
jgi:hypothetical protein